MPFEKGVNFFARRRRRGFLKPRRFTGVRGVEEGFFLASRGWPGSSFAGDGGVMQ